MEHIPVNPRPPWHLWVVGILALLFSAIGAVDYLMTETRNAAYLSQFPPQMLEYVFTFPAWVIALWALTVWGGVAGAVLLLLRNRHAVAAFTVSLGTGVLLALQNYSSEQGRALLGDAVSITINGVILLVTLGFLLYARAMRRKGFIR